MGILPGSAGDVDTGAHFLNSANGTGSQSLAKLPDLDQTTVNTTYQTDLGGGGSVFSNVSGPLGQIFGDVAGLPDAFGRLISALFGTAGPWGTISGAIGTIEHNIIGGIQQTIVLINAAVAAVQSFINNVINAIIAGLRGFPLGLGVAPADALAALSGAVNTQQNNQQNATITIAAVAGYRNPAWVSRHPVGDVTFPLAFGYFVDVQGVTSTPSAGTSHTHSMTNFGVNHTGPALQAMAPNVSRGSYITTAVNTVYDTAAFYGAATAASPVINNVFLEVFRENPDGSLILLNSVNVASQLVVTTPGGPVGYVEAVLDPPIIANAGDRYMCRMRNSSTTSQGAGLWGMDRTSVAPDVAFTTLGATDTNRTSYTPAQAVTARAADLACLWFNLASVNRPLIDQSFSDTFDRTALGGLWYQKSSNVNLLNIVDKQVSYIGTTAGDQAALYIAGVSGDQMLVEANQYGRVSAAGSGPMSCCNRDLSQTVYLDVRAAAAKLMVGPWNGLTDTGVSVATTSADAKWSIYNDPSTAIFTILKDGTDVGAWPDTGGLVKHGNDYRFGGLRTSRVGTVNGGAQDNWTLRDFAA